MAEEEVPVRYEDLADIEAEFDEIDTEIRQLSQVVGCHFTR